MENEQPNALSDDYYLVNFHALVSFVTETYSDLLKHDEKHWYTQICTLSDSAQRLYIRLLTRRGSTFRRSRLCYPEICNPDDAVLELEQRCLASSSPPEDFASLAACFTKAELADLLDLAPYRNCSRVDLLIHLQAGDEKQVNQFRAKLQSSDCWVTIHGHRYFTLMQLSFFGNLHQNISEFVLRDLGTVRYASYQISLSDRPFRSREQIEAHLIYYECQALAELIDNRNSVELIQLEKKLPNYPGDVHLSRRVDRLRNNIARRLERLSEHAQAMELYTRSSHPPARERRVRGLLAKQRLDEAHELCAQMQSHPANETEQLMASRLMRQLYKASNLPTEKKRVFQPVTNYLVLRSSQDRVEQAVCSFYKRQGECKYVENALFNGVLGLVIWDIIFQPMPGAFFNPFQSGPADIQLPAFARKRQIQLAERMQDIATHERFRARVLDTFREQYGTVNRLIHWERLDKALLERAVQCIPIKHWLAIFNRVLIDPGENSTGFPDLVYFPDKGGYELIEVKGPGDTLQSHQRRWLQYFDAHQIPGRVVKVRWSRANSDGQAR